VSDGLNGNDEFGMVNDEESACIQRSSFLVHSFEKPVAQDSLVVQGPLSTINTPDMDAH
jgi:hypothetical protein